MATRESCLLDRAVPQTSRISVLLVTLAAAASAALAVESPAPPASVSFVGPQIQAEGRLVVGPGARIEMHLVDRGNGAGQWRPLVDGQEADLDGPWKPGDHTASLLSADQSARTEPLPFFVDTEGPTLRFKTGTLASFTSRSAEIERTKRERGRKDRKRATPADSPLSWTSGINWEPFMADEQGLHIASHRPQVYLRAPGGAEVEAEGTSLQISKDQVLWIAAEDDAAGVESLHLRWKQAGGGSVLEIETRDNVGNVRRTEWPLSLTAPSADRGR